MAPIDIVAAFDMRVPADRSALHALLRRTPAELAGDRHHAAWSRIDRFVLRQLTPAQRVDFLLERKAPADLGPALTAQLNRLLAAERVARAQMVAAAAPQIRKAA